MVWCWFDYCWCEFDWFGCVMFKSGLCWLLFMKIVSREELKQLIESKGKYVLIDVREKDELVHGVIPSAHNIPLGEVEAALDFSSEDFKKKYGFALVKSDRLIFHCRSGGRSKKATEFALQKG